MVKGRGHACSELYLCGVTSSTHSRWHRFNASGKEEGQTARVAVRRAMHAWFCSLWALLAMIQPLLLAPIGVKSILQYSLGPGVSAPAAAVHECQCARTMSQVVFFAMHGILPACHESGGTASSTHPSGTAEVWLHPVRLAAHSASHSRSRSASHHPRNPVERASSLLPAPCSCDKQECGGSWESLLPTSELAYCIQRRFWSV